MTQQLRVCVFVPQDPGLIPGTHMTAHNGLYFQGIQFSLPATILRASPFPSVPL